MAKFGTMGTQPDGEGWTVTTKFASRYLGNNRKRSRISSEKEWLNAGNFEKCSEGQTMKKKTYTLNVRQTGQYQYEVTVTEIGAMKMTATLNSELNVTLHEILKPITTRSLILVITDHDGDRQGLDVYPR